MKKRVLYSYVAILVLILQMFVPLSTTYAAGGQQIQVDILDVVIKGDKQSFYNGEQIGFDTGWEIPKGTKVSPGDYILLTYPPFLKMAAQSYSMEHGVCEPFGDHQMRCTFDERIQDRDSIKGTLQLRAQLTVEQGSGKQEYAMTVNGVSKGYVTIDGGSNTGETGPIQSTGREIGKWGSHSMVDPSIIDWTVEMNGNKDYYEVRLVDRPQEGHKIVPESISIGINDQIVTKDSPHVKSFHVSEDLIDITLYTYRLDYPDEKYMAILYYSTKIVNPTQKEFKNTATLINNQTSEQIGSKEETVNIWGGASSQGELAKYQGMLNIHKVNEEGQPLAGAIFTLKGMDDNTYEVESDQQGNAKFENLNGGFYTLAEVKAPEGYKIDVAFEDIMLNFKEQSVITHQVVNKKIEEPITPEPETPVVPEEPTTPEPETPVVPEEPTTPEPETPVVPEEPTPSEPETPVEPTEPTPSEPVTPVEPSEPTPSEPETPVEPTEPTPSEPVTPVEPTEPTPSEPVTPVEPSEPTPSEPVTPVEPTEPTPSEPVTPVEPTEPTPSEPVTPVEPTEPTEPTPSEPVTPVEPSEPTPSEPETPVEPSEPTPSEPETPVVPEEPTKPEPTTPEQPVEEDKPAVVVPEKPKPSKPSGGGSSKPSVPTNPRPQQPVVPEQPVEEDKPVIVIPEEPVEEQPIVKPEQPVEEDQAIGIVPEYPEENLGEEIEQPEEIEEEELGEVVVNEDSTPTTSTKKPSSQSTSNVPTLPQTGEEHMLIMQWAGVLLALFGSVLLFTRKKEAKS